MEPAAPKTTKSAAIRDLARAGLSVAHIARRLGISYQHAYNVLKQGDSGSGVGVSSGGTMPLPSAKPTLSTHRLIEGGFELCGTWQLLSNGQLAIDKPIPKQVGVYAFAKQGTVLYVGVATIGLAKRLYFYARPGPSQRTSIRLNEMIRLELGSAASIEVYTATPPDLAWNGFPVHGSAGLELGLIKTYSLPWNVRST